jgi:enamine deaminase RidA (YjgF/YER057c/UK114 family)
MRTEYLQPEQLFPSGPFGFSQVVVSTGSRHIHCAGQTAWDEDMQLVGSMDLGQQMQKALENVGHALEAAGASPANVVRIMTFVVDYRPEYAAVLGQAMAEFFGAETLPAATLVGVPLAIVAVREVAGGAKGSQLIGVLAATGRVELISGLSMTVGLAVTG